MDTVSRRVRLNSTIIYVDVTNSYYTYLAILLLLYSLSLPFSILYRIVVSFQHRRFDVFFLSRQNTVQIVTTNRIENFAIEAKKNEKFHEGKKKKKSHTNLRTAPLRYVVLVVSFISWC